MSRELLAFSLIAKFGGMPSMFITMRTEFFKKKLAETMERLWPCGRDGRWYPVKPHD